MTPATPHENRLNTDRLTQDQMKLALSALDRRIAGAALPPFELIVGGGGAMVLAHGYPLATSDIDAIPRGLTVAELDPFVKAVAEELGIASDWLNPYFSTFAHTLPPDYGARLIDVFLGAVIRARALGREEMLIMKCFAHRAKDVGHARALVRGGADIAAVERRIESLGRKRIPGAQDALDFLDDVLEQEGR